MLIQELLFYVFSFLLIVSSFLVVISRNPVRCTLALVSAFVMSAALWLLLEAEFLALILILVYVGAVVTLFMFVVMMLNISQAQLEWRLLKRHLPIAVIVVAFTVAIMFAVLGPAHFGFANFPNPSSATAEYSNVKALGEVLYTQYAYPFELAAVLLLVGMIAAIALSLRGTRNRKVQNIDQQVRVQKQDRVKMINIPTEKDWLEKN